MSTRATLFTAPLMTLLEEAGEGILVLVDELVEDEFRRSRLTRAEVVRQLRLMADTLAALPAAARESMPELDWAGWRGASVALAGGGAAADEAAWFAARSLVPATLSWLRVYRRDEPGLFSYRP